VTNGWYINLDTPAGTAYSERLITDPLAATNGVVFFTTFSPNTDICAYGGYTNLWGVKYDTASAVGDKISGVGLLQVSTGAIEQVSLSSRFGDKTDVAHKLGRRTDAIDGVPPTGQGLSIIVPPKPLDTILSIRKK
jgi:type IV pilus assembly protein PilY1